MNDIIDVPIEVVDNFLSIKTTDHLKEADFINV